MFNDQNGNGSYSQLKKISHGSVDGRLEGDKNNGKNEPENTKKSGICSPQAVKNGVMSECENAKKSATIAPENQNKGSFGGSVGNYSASSIETKSKSYGGNNFDSDIGNKSSTSGVSDFGKYIREASYCANSGGVGDTITVSSGGVCYPGRTDNRASSDPTECAISGTEVNGKIGGSANGAVGGEKAGTKAVGSERGFSDQTRSIGSANGAVGGEKSGTKAGGSERGFSDQTRSIGSTNGAVGGEKAGTKAGAWDKSSDTTGRTQEKVDMKEKSRADVNKLYGGRDKDGEKSDPPSITLRGGFISDGDIFGTGEDQKASSNGKSGSSRSTSEDAVSDLNDYSRRTSADAISDKNGGTADSKKTTRKDKRGSGAPKGAENGISRSEKSSEQSQENTLSNSNGVTRNRENAVSGAENALGNSEFSSYGDFKTTSSSAEWHGTTDTDPLNEDEPSYEDENRDGSKDGNGNASKREIWAEYGDGNEDDESDEKKETIEPEKRENDKKNDKTIVTGEGERQIKTIVIAGQIEGHSQLPQGQKATRYEELIPELVEIEESDKIGGLLLILNTVGGDVEAGLALSELIAGMKKPTASLVLGGGHSIGVPLAVSAKRSFIVPSATMTLHPVRITGMILGAPQTYVYLNKMQERIIDFTCNHCKMTPERFNELMLGRDEMSTDLGSVLDGRQAVDEGLIDALGTLNDAITFLKDAMK